MSSVEHLKWDSDFFKKKIGSLTYENSFDNLELDLAVCKNQGFDFIYLFSKTNHPIVDKLLRDYQGKKVDTKVTFEKTLSVGNNIEIGSNITTTNVYTQELEALAILSGSHSRFVKDDYFNKEQFEELYKIWLKNSLSGKIANVVLVYTIDSKEVGFVTVKVNDGTGHIGLIAVNNQYQGLKIGKQLMLAAEHYLAEKDINTLQVPTQQENEQACAFYTKLGFKILQTQDTYHFTI